MRPYSRHSTELFRIIGIPGIRLQPLLKTTIPLLQNLFLFQPAIETNVQNRFKKSDAQQHLNFIREVYQDGTV